jgi:hypothetical protein
VLGRVALATTSRCGDAVATVAPAKKKSTKRSKIPAKRAPAKRAPAKRAPAKQPPKGPAWRGRTRGLLAASLSAVLWLAFVGVGLYALTSLLASLAGFDGVDGLWQRLHHRLPGGAIAWRFSIFFAVHAGLLFLWRRLHRYTSQALTRALEALGRRLLQGRARLRLAAMGAYAAVLSLLIVPLILQPTLVPLRFGARSWLHRAANLLDGTATVTVVDGTFGFYGRLAKPLPDLGAPIRSLGTTEAIDRWDRLIDTVVAGNRRDFAMLKAFIWVESGGRQFAVSHTGCLGIMQFCRGTAQLPVYRRIFGRGRLYPCACDVGRCFVERDVQVALESGDRAQLRKHRHAFVCDYADARFDVRRSLEAGLRYLKWLDGRFAGNLSLMYIGYNSGPAISQRILRRLGRRRAMKSAEIAAALPAALRPTYGASANSRAKGLSRVHLPKLHRAYQRYLANKR